MSPAETGGPRGFAARWNSRFAAHAGEVRNTTWLLGDRVVRLGLSFIVGVWVVRYLGPVAFGQLSLALAFVSLFSPLVNLGLDTILVRELVRDPTRRSEILGSAFGLRTIGSVIAAVASCVAIFFVRHDPIVPLLVAIGALALPFQSLDVIEQWFQSQLTVRYAVLARNAALALASLARVGAILASFSVVAFAVVGSAEIALGAIALALAYAWTGGDFSHWRFSRSRARGLLADSWPLIFSNAMIMLYMRIDQLMLGQISGVQELGIYSVAVRLTEVWYLLPMAVVSSLFPSVVRAREQGEPQFYGRLQRLYDFMALCGYAVAVPATLIAQPLVRIAFGPSFAAAALPLQFLVWTVVFTNLGVARSSFLTAMNWPRVHLFTVTAGAVVNIALNLVLIPRYGATGAAVATLIAQWLAVHGACFLYPPMWRTGRMLTRALVLPRPW